MHKLVVLYPPPTDPENFREYYVNTHLPLAVTLRDPALEHAATARPTRETAAFERAAAEELLQARDAALSAMRRQGVLVLDVAPRGAAEAVVERYRQLKRRGIL